MGNNWDREDDYREDKTVSIFGEAEEKTVVEQTPPAQEEVKETAKATNGKSGGKGLTAIVGAAVAIVGIAAITLWQGKEKAAAEAARAAEEQRLEAEEAEKKRLEEEKAAQEREEAEKAEAAAEALSEGAGAEAEGTEPEEEQNYEVNVSKARELYNLFDSYNDIVHYSDETTQKIAEMNKEYGYMNYINDIKGFPVGPIEDMYKLIECYNSGADIQEVDLVWDKKEAVFTYIIQLQKENPIEVTYIIEGEGDDEKKKVIYINTEKSIYYIGDDSVLSSTGVGTVYYNVKIINENMGLEEYWAYDGEWKEGAPISGTYFHQYDDLTKSGSVLHSAANASIITQDRKLCQIYNMYHGDGLEERKIEIIEEEFEGYPIPEWEFGEY